MKFAVLVFLCMGVCACVIPGQSSYINDPLTGGVDSRTSALLHIPLPSGLQYYPSHSRISPGDRKEGLEMLRGHVNQETCGNAFYSALRVAGWNLRLRESAGSRAIYIYQKGDELAAIVFQAQGMLTIVQIWAGPRLADNAILPSNVQDTWSATPAETGTPSGDGAGAVEKWGVEERDL